MYTLYIHTLYDIPYTIYDIPYKIYDIQYAIYDTRHAILDDAYRRTYQLCGRELYPSAYIHQISTNPNCIGNNRRYALKKVLLMMYMSTKPV